MEKELHRLNVKVFAIALSLSLSLSLSQIDENSQVTLNFCKTVTNVYMSMRWAS